MQRYQVQGLGLGRGLVGEGRPVVFLHGWGSTGQSFWPVAQGLAREGFHCHLLDLPGFGLADLPPEPWGVAQYADYVRAYLDEAGLTQVDLVGHSFGGRVAICLSAEYPRYVRKLVLVDSAGVLPAKTWRGRLYYGARALIFTALKVPPLRRYEPGVRAWFRQRYGSPDYKAAGPLTETFKRVIAQDLVPYARRIQAPSLLLWGELDQDTPLRDAKILEGAIPDAGLAILEGAGHFSYLERPYDFIRIVSYFLKA
jgi:pimeloyl-ACP methyl ester carboxylesterase